MADPGFPGQHTTTTTVTTSNTNVQTNIRYDPSYIKTIPGMLKCAQIIMNLLIFLSVFFSHYSSTGQLSFMSLICGLGFWFTGVLLVFYLFHIIEKFFKVPWLKIELIYGGLWTLMLLIGSTLCAAYMGHAAAFGVITFFGLHKYGDIWI
uniref:Cklf-like protein marvel transmembrane domain-containing protein 4 n=1 Tax=Triatoma infestans TaxID=30076 RepID=A0A170WWN5_TRIIF